MRNRPHDRIKLEDASKHLPDLPKCSDSSEVNREFLSKHSGKFADQFVFVEFDQLRGLGCLEARDKGIGQKESHLPTESSSDQSNPVSDIINPQSTLSPNSRLKLQCTYVEWMSQMIIILSIYHLSECDIKESQL